MKSKTLLLCCFSELVVITFVAVANLFDGLLYAIFYNLLYGIGISVSLPLFILLKEQDHLNALGIKKPGARQFGVIIGFVVFSVGGQIIPKLINGETLRWNVLPVAVFPLIMTTFFEEFFFRGFWQTRLEKIFGAFVAMIISGLLFSVYHLGYPGFRTPGDILLLFVVGIAFALSFKLAGNNVIVSYFVNLPNAFITYILKYEQFPVLTAESAIYATVTVILIGLLVLLYNLFSKHK